MLELLSLINGKKKLSHSGWHSFNAVCCHNRGHRQDTRMRGGIKIQDNTQSYHCFNCGFKCSYTLGKSLSGNTRLFLKYCNVDEEQIQKYNLESLKHKDLLAYIHIKKKKSKIKFKEHKLPDAELIDENNEKHSKHIEYLKSRAIDYKEYPYMVPVYDTGRMFDRIIIPYTHHNKVVGHTSRFFDDKFPKYINEQQEGYVFGMDFQKPNYEICILVEGIFDALSINGCALMHNTINDMQHVLLSELNRKIIFVPDHDKTGLDTCDRALELGYHVSIPEWDTDVKDVNDAVKRYGKLMTLLSIIHSATNSKIKIEMQRRKFDKRL